MKWLLVLIACCPLLAATDDAVTIRELITAADRRYEERFMAQERWMKDALSAQEKRAELALAAAEKAVAKAEMASEKRFDSMNEFRGQLKDQTGTFITRNEAWGYFTGFTGLVLGVTGVILGVFKKKGDSG